MDKDLVHKKPSSLLAASDVKSESNGNGNGHDSHDRRESASKNGAAASSDAHTGDTVRTPKKRRKVNHGESLLSVRTG